MRTRFLLAAAAALMLAACSDSSSAPPLSPTKAARETTCRSGYHIATREDGSESCEPEGDGYQAAPPINAPAAVMSPTAARPLAP